MILWPHVLPQHLWQSGYSEALANQMLRTQMDAGPAKVRRRFTAAPRPLAGDIVVTSAQLVFFRAWYASVLLGGSLRFGWTDPGDTVVLTNLLTNYGFDSATTGWTPSAASLASVSGGIWGNCLEITRVSGDQQNALQNVTVVNGNTYLLSAWAKSGDSGDETYDLRAWDITNSLIAGYIQGTTSPEWAHATVEFVASSTSFQILFYKWSATAGTMLFDEVSLVDITTGIVEMRFTEPPSITPIGGDSWRISMKLEILP